MRQSVLAFGQKAQSLPEGEAEAKAGGLEGEGEATLLQGGQPSCSSADGSLSKDEMGLQGLQGQQGQQPEKVFGLFERRAKKPRIPEEGMTDDGQASEVTSQDLSAAGPSRKSSAKRGGKTRTRAAVDVDGADPASSAGAQGTDEGGRARTRRRARKQVQETNVGERPGAPGSAIVVLDDGSDSDYEALGSQKASKAAKPKTKEKAPLPTLTLDVRGTMKASETAKAHPFFAKKPPAAKAPEGAPAGSGANGGVTPGDAGTSGAGPAAETSSGPSRKPADTFFGKAKRRPQLEPLWPSLESIHVRPEGRLHLQLHEREARLAAIQQGFNGGQEDGSIFSTINKGKGKQRESPTGTANQVDPTLAYFAGRAELAKRSAGAADSAGSSSLHPSSIRARHEDFVSSFIASNIDFSKCSMGDVLPPAIQRARSIATSRQAAPDRPLNRSVTKLVESWADRWHPLCAAECLGNEPRAIYLREWMRELQITRVAPVRSADGVTQGTGAEGMTARLQEGGANTSASALLPSQKKRPVQKKVEKKAVQRAKRRKKNRDGYGPEDDNGDMADFIVDDEDDSWLDAYPSSMKDSCDEELAAHTHRTQPDPSAVNDMLRRAIDGATGPNRMQIDPQLSASPSPATVTTPLPGTSASALPHVGLENSGSEDFARADKLTNCILLCGPTGAGKTASVYACAAELGYEVFELWPGMGKRGGKDLSSAVGALGRNHMVSSGGTGGGAMWRGNAAMRTKPSATESGADVYSKLLAAANGQNGADEHCGDADGIATPTAELHSAVEAGSTSGVISAQSPDNPNNTLPNSNALGDTPSLKEKDLSVRQSLILIEEVDIVYEEDKSFWAGIVALTAESRRPVVLTCNDINLVPLDQLPIQEVLRFDPPSADIAVPYLQLVALAEGHALSKSSVEQLYSSTGCLNAGADSLLPPSSDGPLHPKIELCTTERKSSLGPTLGATYDLRCAINHLHYWCQWAVGASRDPLGLLPAARERWHSTGNDTTESVWSQDSLQGSGLTDLSPVTILGESSGRSTSDRLSGLEQLSWQLCSAYAADEGSVDAQDHVRLRSEMQALARFTDALSFSDSALCQPFERACETLEPDLYGPSANDPQTPGKIQLFKPLYHQDEPALPSYGREGEFAFGVMLAALGTLHQSLAGRQAKVPKPVPVISGYNTRRLALSKKLDEALAPVKILASNRLPRAVAAVDYAPYVRRMVALDDLEQHAHEQSLAAARAANNGTEGSHSSRSTRNSTRLYTIAGSRSGDYERWLPLDADAQHSARETFLW